MVLHVDSRGGSAMASGRMLHAVRRCAEKKPVVAYFNDVAASGGYMVGVGCHEIVAQPLTITGSIGVVAARLVLAPLMERLGVDWATLRRGERVDMLSPHRPMSPEANEAFMLELEELYGFFVQAVAEGRKKTTDEVETLARGRVWSGCAAQRHGLVDTLGDFQVAVERLRGLVGPNAGRAEPRLVAERAAPKLQPLLNPLAEAAAWVLDDYGRELAQLSADPRGDPFWAWAPLY
jgi:protease-4